MSRSQFDGLEEGREDQLRWDGYGDVADELVRLRAALESIALGLLAAAPPVEQEGEPE
jgi:hypothetical protein